MSNAALTVSDGQLPATIRSFIAGFDALRRRRQLWRAMGLAAGFSTLWILACCLADRAWKLNSGLRLSLLIIHAVLLLLLSARPCWRMLVRRIDWMEAAEDIEARDPPLEGRLQTVTSQALERNAGYRGSPDIVEQLSSEVAQRLAAIRPERLIPNRPVLRAWMMTAIALLVASALVRLPTLDLPTLAMRYFLPTAKIASVTTTRLSVTPGDGQVVEGNDLKITVRADRLGANRTVRLYVRTAGTWTSTEMQRSTTDPARFAATVADVDQELRYYLTGGDATSPVFSIHPLRRPAVHRFLADCEYPVSTRKAHERLTIDNGLLEAPVGTRVTISAVATEPLSAARLTWGGSTVAVEMAPADRPEVRQATFEVTSDTEYLVSLTSRQAIQSSTPAKLAIRAIPDQEPVIRLVGTTGELRLHPRDMLTLPYDAIDDWGLRSLRLRIEVDPSQAVEAGVLRNVARGKPTTQSSTAFGADSSRAVDGNSSGNFPDGSVTHTNHAAGNFWQVDLGSVIPISVVEIWNRTDAAPERLSDFHVLISDQPIEPTATAQPGVDVLPVGGMCGLPSVLDVYRMARYVRVVLPRQEYLSLAEVRVYDAKSPGGEAREMASEYGEEPFGDDWMDAEAAPPTVIERDVPIGDMPARRDGQVQIDLAELNLRLGDVVTLSLSATDSSGQTAASERSRILISPLSVDLDTYRRVRELEGAARAFQITSGELAAAATSLAPADPAQQQVAPQLASAHQHLTGASESAQSAVTRLLRSIARNTPPDTATAIAFIVDGVEVIAGDALQTGERLSINGAAGVADALKQIADAEVSVKVLAQDLAVVLEGEKSAALLAEIENLAASQRVPPQATREAANRVRQRLARMEQDIAAGARELALDPTGTMDLQGQLRQKVAAAVALASARGTIDFSPAAAAWAEQAKQSGPSRVSDSSLVARLTAASRAEAMRGDADFVRARDLGLASIAVGHLSMAAASPSPQPATQPDGPDAMAHILGVLHRQHVQFRSAAGQAAPEAESATVAAAADQARQRLLAIVDPSVTHEPATRPALSSTVVQPDEAISSQRRDEELALRAGALASTGDYEAASRIDRQLLAQSSSPDRVSATNDVLRASAIARRVDQLADAQTLLAQQADDAGAATGEASPWADLTERQRLLSQAIRAAASQKNADKPSDHSRDQADRVLRLARQELASLPDALENVQAAAADRRLARQRAEAARQTADAAGLEQWAAANRAAVSAELQRQEAEARYQQTSEAVDVDVADAIGDSLRPFAPETVEAVRLIDEHLIPALAGLKQAAAVVDAAVMNQAVKEALTATEQSATALGTAHTSLLANDPMLAARSAASAATELLSSPASTDRPWSSQLSRISILQHESAAALKRAAQQANRKAALKRLATLPAMSPFLSAVPPPGSALQAEPRATTQPNDPPPSLFQALRGWGTFSWRLPEDLSGLQNEADTPGYREALNAYFLAIHNADAVDAGPATQEVK